MKRDFTFFFKAIFPAWSPPSGSKKLDAPTLLGFPSWVSAPGPFVPSRLARTTIPYQDA